MMKTQFLTAIFALAIHAAFAQIPFEVMAGNKQTLYFAYIQKDLDSVGRWNIFSQSLFAVNYKDNTQNAISMEGQLTYQFNNWLGVSFGGGFDGYQVNPTLGLSLGYWNHRGDFSISAFPMVQLAKPIALDFFALINYSPQFNKKWGLFSQLIVGTNLGLQREYPNQERKVFNIFTNHNISNQLLRVGMNYKRKFQFGLGTDLAQFGINAATFENFGLFIRYQIE